MNIASVYTIRSMPSLGVRDHSAIFTVIIPLCSLLIAMNWGENLHVIGWRIDGVVADRPPNMEMDIFEIETWAPIWHE